MMHRRTFLHTALAAGLASFALPGLARAEGGETAERFIEDLADKAIATMSDRQLPDAERTERFHRLFVSSFDIPEIGRFVLSRYWRTASPDQQQEFLRLFEEYTVLIWSKRFKEYSGEKLHTLSATKDGERGWLVDSRIDRPQGPPIPIQWRLRQAEDGSFKIVDIVVEGVSMAITHRSDYAAAMQANGGHIDGLMSAMRTKIDQLRAQG